MRDTTEHIKMNYLFKGFGTLACLFSLCAFGSGAFTDKCLSCICEIEGCNGQIDKCGMDVGSLSCGPYQIKYNYWIDCGRLGTGYQGCTKKKGCSENCVRAYLSRYGTYCTRGYTPTCEDYARIHNGGPTGCRKSSTRGYWSKIQSCCNRVGGCD